MTEYIACRALTKDGMPILTKKALRSYVADGDVRFARLFSIVTPSLEGYTVAPRPEITITVAGPDPETDRRWYANVRVTPTGKIVVE